jgi:transcriptional regulator with XRE-family HTH domain
MSKKLPSKPALRRAFTRALRKLRWDRNLSQEKLAHAAGLDRAYMSDLERGQHSPTLETVYKIVTALGITLTEFARDFERFLNGGR